MRISEMQSGAHAYVDAHRQRKRWLAVLTCMAAVVALCVVCALTMPASTLETETVCGMEEHSHDSSCYETTLTCGQEEDGTHVHDESCYEETLVCDKTEHTHSDACYASSDDEAAQSDDEDEATEDSEDEIIEAATLPDGAEIPDGYTESYTVRDDDNGFAVTVYAAEGVIPEDVTLSVELLSDDTDEYASAQDTLAAEADDDDYDFAALDIHFEDADGNEVEPDGDVYVVVDAEGLLSDDADADTVVVQHLVESGDDVSVETVADAADETDGVVTITDESVVQAAFSVDSFSTFTISWTSNSGGPGGNATSYFTVTVHYVDEDGNEIQGTQTTNVSANNVGNNGTTYTFSSYAGSISGYTYSGAHYSSYNGDTVTSMTFSQGDNRNPTRTLTFYNENSTVETLTYRNSTQNVAVYLVYTAIPGTLVITSDASEYVGRITSHQWTVSEEGIVSLTDTSSASVTVTAEKEGEVTVTHTYSAGGTTYTENYTVKVTKNDSGELEANAYVKVYIYVSSEDISDECLELLGISRSTLDASNYFPAGEIELNIDYFDDKGGLATAAGTGLINDDDDWTELLGLLSEMDTTTLIDQTNSTYTGLLNDYKLDYTVNRNNSVGSYLEQAIVSYGSGWGSQSTALFHWHYNSASSGCGHYGFEDQTVQYHLDLKFSTNKITFVFGNNGLNNDGQTADSRTYITGSAIQTPADFTSMIPEGYYFDGFYTDANFTTEWDGIGDPLTKDTTVYIKLTKDPVMSITLTKEVSGAEVSDQDYTFTIATTNSDVSGNTYTSSNTTNITFSNTANEDGYYTATVTLTATSKDGTDAATIISGLPLGTYTITENTSNASIDGYTFTGVSYSGGTGENKNTVTGDENNANVTVAVTNTYTEVKAVDITVTKEDSQDATKLLSGAEFYLTKTGENNSTLYYNYDDDTGVTWVNSMADATTFTSSSSEVDYGTFTITALEDGTYYLVETKAPDGYQLPTGDFTFTVSGGKITAASSDRYTDDTITVTNDTGQELPETGGSGTTLFTIGGLLLVAAAVGGGYATRCLFKKGGASAR